MNEKLFFLSAKIIDGQCKTRVLEISVIKETSKCFKVDKGKYGFSQIDKIQLNYVTCNNDGRCSAYCLETWKDRMLNKCIEEAANRNLE